MILRAWIHMIETTWKSLGLEHLPMTDKIDLVEKLLEELNAEAEAQPIPTSHVEELRRRIAESKAPPNEGSPWEGVKADIENELLVIRSSSVRKRKQTFGPLRVGTKSNIR